LLKTLLGYNFIFLGDQNERQKGLIYIIFRIQLFYHSTPAVTAGMASARRNVDKPAFIFCGVEIRGFADSPGSGW